MSKPSTLPEWDTNETNVTAADTSHKDDGWTVTAGVPEKPPVEYDNWYKNLVYKWIDWLDDSSIPVGSLIEHYGVNPDASIYAESGDIIDSSVNSLIKNILNPDLTLTNRSADSFTGALKGVIHNGSMFVAVGGSTGEIQTSPDGTTWTQQTQDTSPAATFFESVAWGSSIFVAVGTTGAVGVIQSSPDGVTWTSRSLGSGATDNLVSVIYANSIFIAVGANGAIQTSPDGTTWTQRTAAGSYSGIFKTATYNGSVFIIAGDSGEIQTSPDGITWTQRTAAGSYSGGFTGATYANGIIILVGPTGEIQTSTDGTTWTQQVADGSYSGTFFDVDYIDSIFIAVGTLGEIQTSVDSVNWVQLFTTGATYNGLAGTGTTVVIVSEYLTTNIRTTDTTDREVPTFSTSQTGFTQYMRVA